MNSIDTRTNRIGRHLQTSVGLHQMLENARELGCEAFQFFVSNPQGWAMPTPRDDAASFVGGLEELSISPAVVHAKYLINLAAKDDDAWERSVRTLAAELSAAGAVGAELVVVHSGSHGGSGEKAGVERLVAGVQRARELSLTEYPAGERSPAEPILENSVGAGTQLCASFEELSEAAEQAGARVCVDTAHAFVAGYDLSTPESAAEVGAELKSQMGDRVALLHLNDAKNELGSHRDGHRKVGDGRIPEDSFTQLFAALPGIPAVMETPRESPEADAREVRRVKKLAGGLPIRRKAV